MDDVQTAWETARTALEMHARLGVQLQRRGLELLGEGENLRDAQGLISEGVRMEADAKLRIYQLERNKPKKGRA